MKQFFIFTVLFSALLAVISIPVCPVSAYDYDEDDVIYLDPRESSYGTITANLSRPRAQSRIMQERARDPKLREEDGKLANPVYFVDAATGKISTGDTRRRKNSSDPRYLLCSRCRAKAVVEACDYCRELDSDFNHLCDTCIKKALINACEKCRVKIKEYRKSQGLADEDAGVKSQGEVSSEEDASGGKKIEEGGRKKNKNIFRRMFGRQNRSDKRQAGQSGKVSPAETGPDKNGTGQYVANKPQKESGRSKKTKIKTDVEVKTTEREVEDIDEDE